MLLLATILLLNYYSRLLPTETQKFFGNFWKVYNISEISENFPLYGIRGEGTYNYLYYILEALFSGETFTVVF